MMQQEVPYMIGATVTADDGPCGTLEWVVIDPIVDIVTHVVVNSPHHQGAPRLVPVKLLELSNRSDERIAFHGTVADFFRLAIAEETRFLPAQSGYTDPDRAMFWPFFVGEEATPGMSGIVTEDHLPLGEVDVRRGDPVHASDGEIGHVKGLVVTRSDRHVTHLLLQEGHLFGRKEVSIPVSAISTMAGGVRLNLTKQQVRDLPPVDHDRP